MSSGKQLIRGKSGMRMIAASENERSPFLLEEPRWTNDDQFPNCVKCNRKFDFTHRRHHCRRCGMIFCGSCCDHKVMLPRLSFVDPVRVCGECSQISKREEEFFEKHLKILSNGAHFVVDESGPLTFLCKLEHHFHRELLFECSVPDRAAFHEPVLLEKIVSAQLVSNEDGSAVSGLILKYKQQDEMLEVKLTVVTSPDVERKQALSWLVAMQKAIKMLFEVGS